MYIVWPTLGSTTAKEHGPDFQNFLRRSQENLRKMTELTEILGKRYDTANFRHF